MFSEGQKGVEIFFNITLFYYFFNLEKTKKTNENMI